ncbi:MAG: TrkA C-terminal domain-containing protein [Phycisphaerales bacterium]
MGAIISLLIIAGVSLVIVRIGATALMLTGLSWDIASFQAYSAFFGVGFTTAEAELAVCTPHRRRIITHLIIAGNLGLTAGLGSMIVAFVKAEGTSGELHVLGWAVGGLLALILVGMTPPVRRLVDWCIRLTLRTSGVVHAADYSLLLRLHAGYGVSDIALEPASRLVGHSLRQLRLGSQGVVILGIARRDGSGNEVYIGTPHGDEELRAGDVLTVYGKPERVEELVR